MFQTAQLLLSRQIVFFSSLCSTFQFHYCSVSSWWLLADKLASSMETAGDCGNLIAAKSITRRFLVQYHISLCDQHTWWQPATANQPVKEFMFSLKSSGRQSLTDWSLGLCEWGPDLEVPRAAVPQVATWGCLTETVKNNYNMPALQHFTVYSRIWLWSLSLISSFMITIFAANYFF